MTFTINISHLTIYGGLRIEQQHSKSCSCLATNSDLEKLEQTINMTKQEIIAAVAAANEDLTEALGEIGTKIADQQALITSLQEAVANLGIDDPEFIASLEQLTANAQALADIIPNDPPPVPTEPTE